MNATDIEAQVGAAQGLWTHTPVDWAGNEGGNIPAGYPNNASQGYLGIGNGTRPGGAVTQSGPPGAPIITGIYLAGIGPTAAGVLFIINPAPTSCQVNWGTTQAVLNNAMGTATAGSQTVNLSTLVTKTKYWVQIQAANASGTALSNLLAFTTL
jgi:hypothetical protein